MRSRKAKRTEIPRFFLYGEPSQRAERRFVHAETIASRSALTDWTIRAHRHGDLHHLLTIAEGGGVLTADGETFAFEGGCAIIVPAGVVHGFAFRAPTDGHVATFAGAVTQSLAEEEPSLATLFGSTRILGKVAPSPGVLEALVAETEQAGAHAGLAARSLLALLLVAAARAAGAQDPSRQPSRAASLVARFGLQVDRQLSSGWSVADHALALGVQPARLRAACVAVTGAPPIALVHARLVAEAKRQLSHTDRTVSEVAYGLGFDDPAYFSRFFARCAGASPMAFRASRQASSGQ